MCALSIRLRRPDDDAAIVAISNHLEGDTLPLSVAQYRQDATADRWVAEESGAVLGHAALDSAWWTGRDDVFLTGIYTRPERWGQGVGGALWEVVRAEIGARGGQRVLAWVREDCTEGREFAARRGFGPEGTVLEEFRLDLRHAPEVCAADEEAVSALGIRIVTLADLPNDDAFLRQVQGAYADREPSLPLSVWRREVLEAPGLSPEWHWVAMDGDRPVGGTYLKIRDDQSAENDFTGVHPAYRGRHIARVLKHRAMVWARERGMRWFYTDSRIENTAMIAVNRRLGYQATGRRVLLEQVQ